MGEREDNACHRHLFPVIEFLAVRSGIDFREPNRKHYVEVKKI